MNSTHKRTPYLTWLWRKVPALALLLALTTLSAAYAEEHYPFQLAAVVVDPVDFPLPAEAVPVSESFRQFKERQAEQRLDQVTVVADSTTNAPSLPKAVIVANEHYRAFKELQAEQQLDQLTYVATTSMLTEHYRQLKERLFERMEASLP